MPRLSYPYVPEWFKFGVHAELNISILSFTLGFLRIGYYRLMVRLID